jgi:hypothetical protein
LRANKKAKNLRLGGQFIDKITGMVLMKGICKECKIRNNDTTEKEITLCHLCEEYFCDYHVSPKIVVLSPTDFRKMKKDAEYRKAIGKLLELMEEDLERNDGHPCLPYTHYKWEEMGLETKRLYEVLDKLGKHKKHTNLRKALLAFIPIAIIIIILFFMLGR